MKKTWQKRILSVLLTLLMLCGAIPLLSIPSSAADINGQTVTSTAGSPSVAYDLSYTKSRPNNSQMTYTFTVKCRLPGGTSSWIGTGHAFTAKFTVKGSDGANYSNSVLIRDKNASWNTGYAGTYVRKEVSVSVTCNSTVANATQAVTFEVIVDNYDDSKTGSVTNSSHTVTSSPLQSVTVYFDPNGGSANFNNTTATPGTYTTLPTASRGGYTCNGWYTAASGGTKVGDNGGNYYVSEAVTLYAQWTMLNYTVTYNANGGTNAPPAANVRGDNPVYTIPDSAPIRTGYTFRGWTVNDNTSEHQSSQGNWKNAGYKIDPVLGNIILYAVWQTNKYNIKYDKNSPEATGAMANSEFSYDVAANLTACLFARTGYVFQGWAESATGEKRYNNLQNVVNLSTVEGATITLYALWGPIGYTVSFHSNGGNGTMLDQGFTYGNPAPLQANTFNRIGYDFAGWAFSSAGVALYADGAVPQDLTNIGGANVPLYAKWQPRNNINYKVEHYLQNLNGTYNALPDHEYTYSDGTSDALKTIVIPTYEGYALDSTAQGATEITLAISPNGSTVYRLYFERRVQYDVFRLTIDKKGGTGGSNGQSDLREGDIVQLVPPTPPTGMQFAGWTSSVPAVVFNGNSFTMPGSDLTVTAVWASKTYNISYHANGGQNTPAAQTKVHGTPLNLAQAVPTRDGFIFTGWAASASAIQAEYAAGGEYTANGDILLYAVWSKRGLVSSDIYSFSNSKDNFGSNYFINNADTAKLYAYIKKMYPDTSNHVRDDISAQRFSIWQGSCYGMAATVMLDKSGDINVRRHIGSNVSTLYGLPSPKSNSALESAINYYAVSQVIPDLRPQKFEAGHDTYKDGLRQLVADAKEGKNIFFCYFFPCVKVDDAGQYVTDNKGELVTDQNGHAIVIVGYQGYSNGWHTLLAYDNRCPSRDIPIKINQDFTNCYIECGEAKCNNSKCNGRETVAGFEALTDMSRFSIIDIDGQNNQSASQTGSQGSSTEIRFAATCEDITITNANQQTLRYDADSGTVSGTMQILNSGFLVNSTADNHAAPVTFVYEVADSDSFKFKAAQAGLDVAVVSDSIYASASAGGAKEVAIGARTGVAVSGDGLYDCKLSLGINNGYCDVLQLSALADKTASMRYDGTKVVASADYDKAGSANFITNLNLAAQRVLGTTTAGYYEISWAADGTPIIRAANVAPAIVGDKNVTIDYLGEKQLQATGADLSWSSSNTKYVTVDASTGKITSQKNFIKTGSVAIRATNSAGYVEFNVKVKPTFIQWIMIIFLFGWIWM